jgi:hypothetical protein
MKKVLSVLNAIIGFAGSSENPQKMSLRLTAVVMGIIAKFSPLLVFVASSAMHLPEGVTAENVQQTLEPVVQAFIFIIAGVLWLVGAFRAGWIALKMPEKIGAYLR